MLSLLTWLLRTSAVVFAVLGGAALWEAAPPGVVEFRSALRASSECRLRALTRSYHAFDWMQRQQQQLARCPPPPRVDWDRDMRTSSLLLLTLSLNVLVLSEIAAASVRRRRLTEEIIDGLEGHHSV